jgi:hypothetical protein
MDVKAARQQPDIPEHDPALHERFASLVDTGTKAAFVLTLSTFVLYVSGILPALVPPAALPRLWRLPLAQYLEQSGAPAGWDWLRFVAYGDYLNYAGICLFALVIMVCSACVLPLLRRRGEYLLAGLALAQVLVLLAAASGLLSAAG